jgi:hypothetical protein
MQALTMRRWETGGLLRRFEGDGVFLDAGRAEVVGQAADADDQRVVAEDARRDDFLAAFVDVGRRDDQLLFPVDADHFAVAVAVAVPVGLGQVVDLVGPEVHAAGRDFMQVRLPEVGLGFFDQGDRRLAFLAQLVAELGGQFEATRSAADDDDLVQVGIRPFDVERRAAAGTPGVVLCSHGVSRYFFVKTGRYLIPGRETRITIFCDFGRFFWADP